MGLPFEEPSRTNHVNSSKPVARFRWPAAATALLLILVCAQLVARQRSQDHSSGGVAPDGTWRGLILGEDRDTNLERTGEERDPLEGAAEEGGEGRGKEARACPRWFKFIEEDLETWGKTGGLTKEVLERGLAKAHLRIQVIDGKLYSQHFRRRRCFLSREPFTLWGFAMLLRRYPGQVPDVDLALNCRDQPMIERGEEGEGEEAPGALLQYCKSADHAAILWPDFSFWGYPEMNIPRWGEARRRISGAADRLLWGERERGAYWRGNTRVTTGNSNKGLRQALYRCWKLDGGKEAGLDVEDPSWTGSGQKGDMTALMPVQDQCQHKGKVYIEGATWSVSLKYSLACGSSLLLVEPRFYDFFSRGLKNGTHFLHVSKGGSRFKGLCSAMKDALEWMESHEEEALRIAESGRLFAERDLDMDIVYDYMLHTLRAYASLQRFEVEKSPTVTPVVAMDLEEWAANQTWPERHLNVWEEEKETPPCIM